MMTLPQSASGQKYRPEIDGLRALAILPVVLFHYQVPGFRGGFVGVDVFFVISGYLITSLITGEMTAGRFSLLNFYERRIRRIFPALFAMLAGVSVVAYIVLFPTDLVRYAKSLLATAFFASNFQFWSEAGYFDVAGSQKPLLHLWSIAVEEQFYLLFPAFLLLLGWMSAWWQQRRQSPLRLATLRVARHLPRRRGRNSSSHSSPVHGGGVEPSEAVIDRGGIKGEAGAGHQLLVGGISTILLLSFAFSVWGVQHAKDAAFYLLPSRAWELMLGALLALGAVPAIPNKIARTIMAVIGLALIGYAVGWLSSDMPSPGLLALLPCAGAALVIHATTGDQGVVGRLLSARPLVFVGLISYSLYLWHWPLYVFARYILFRDLNGGETAALIAASFVLAALSWRFVETPLRRPMPRRKLFPAAATAIAVAFATGAVSQAMHGLPQRLSPRLQKILAEQNDAEPRIDRCFALTADDVRAGRLCTIGAKSEKPSFVLWGDSHADAILPAIARAARNAGRTGIFAGGASCVPLFGVSTWAATCKPFNDAVEKVLMQPQITEVIMEARWAKYADGWTYGREPRGRVVIADAQSDGRPPPPDNHAVFARGLERTIRELVQGGKKVVLVASVPEVGWPVPAVLARRALAHDKKAPDITLDSYLERQSFVTASFAHMQSLYGVTVINPKNVLCNKTGCEVSLNGIPLYRDEHHLSVYGALQLEPLFRDAL